MKNQITKTFSITATPDTMQKFERFLAFFHYNGGHSATFGMSFDGDGHERLKVDPPPDRQFAKEVDWIGGCGPELEIAGQLCYTAVPINREKHKYIANKDGLFLRSLNGVDKHLKDSNGERIQYV